MLKEAQTNFRYIVPTITHSLMLHWRPFPIISIWTNVLRFVMLLKVGVGYSL